MSALRKRWVVLLHPDATIRFGRKVFVGPRFRLDIPGKGTFIVGDDVEFRRGFRAEISGSGRVIIGTGCSFTYDVLIACTESIEIGDRVTVARSTGIYDGNHNYRDLSAPVLEQGFDFRPIRIGDGALILSQCVVVNDVGERAVIGANSVVTKPMPPFTLAAGAPARTIEHFGPAAAASPDQAPARDRETRPPTSATPRRVKAHRSRRFPRDAR